MVWGRGGNAQALGGLRQKGCQEWGFFVAARPRHQDVPPAWGCVGDTRLMPGVGTRQVGIT